MAGTKFQKALKWIGYATAILSLIAGVRELVKVVADRAEEHRQIDALLASERVQMQGKDYPSAWQSLEQASQIDAGSAPVRAAQESLAMEWLENIRIGENERFSDITNKLDPVLTRGIASAKTGQRQADLLAHLGWSYFLRSRDGTSGLDPAATYAEAVKTDPNNPYAQAMWGHWILWNDGDAEDANRHFASALASGRERVFVRRLQLSGLLDSRSDKYDEETVRTLNAVRKEQGSVDPEISRQVLSVYYGATLPPNEDTMRLIRAVPPAEHLATFRWLFDKLGLSESESLIRSAWISLLEEQAGQRSEALAGYQAIRRQLAGRPGPLLKLAESGSERLLRVQ